MQGLEYVLVKSGYSFRLFYNDRNLLSDFNFEPVLSLILGTNNSWETRS